MVSFTPHSIRNSLMPLFLLSVATETAIYGVVNVGVGDKDVQSVTFFTQMQLSINFNTLFPFHYLIGIEKRVNLDLSLIGF